MNLRHAVDLVAAHDSQVGHANTLGAALIYDRHAAQYLVITGMLVHDLLQKMMVDLINNLHVAWQNFLEHRNRPCFQRLRHQGVVGVGKGAHRNVPSLIPLHTMNIQQHTHQFGDSDGRVRIVELNRNLVGQVAQILMLFAEAIKHILQRGAYEEILLLEPEFFSHRSCVIGVKNLGNIFSLVLVGNRLDVIAGIKMSQIKITR